ncbi:2Fe-2S iron-sulfur cluster-binding protein [Paralcaligenes ginsengisoli]
MADGSAAVNRAFLDYIVVAKTRESDVITSLILAPVSGVVPDYRPGQHLVFRLDIDGARVLRHYSVSGNPSEPGTLRISVKREPAPRTRPDLPAGLGSGHMHDHVQAGDTLVAAGPIGQFILDETSRRPVLLFSGGVGLTPMMSMLHRLVLSSDRRVYFVHACENGDAHAFSDEVAALARQRQGVTVHFAYREPTGHDRIGRNFHSAGLVGRDVLQALLPLDDYDVYLCGPPAFMQANWRLLRGLGVAAGRIHYEFFGPATVLETGEGEPDNPVAGAATQEPGQLMASPASTAGRTQRTGLPLAPAESLPSVVRAVAATPAAGMQVSFGSTGITVPWDDSCSSLLDLAEQAGLSPDFNCRAGLCNTCMSTLVSGQVDYFEPPLDPPPEGKVLLCCSRPASPLVIELAT